MKTKEKARPDSIRTSVTISKSEYRELEKLASEKRVSIAWVVRDAVEKYLVSQASTRR
jgi:hypothetical protein